MRRTLYEAAVSISELKKNPSRVMADAAGVPLAVLDHNGVLAYLVPAELYEQMLERLDDFELAALARVRATEQPIQVTLEEL